MEENLSLPELEHILKAAREKEYRAQKFAAALKGVNLDEQRDEAAQTITYADVERRAKAKLAGKTEEQVEFDDVGIGFEEDME